jgi:4-diphosphocytidyl-2-C-methyl-D-erythritol kinase
MTVPVRCFAKINLGLHIGAARNDGFHELLTIYQTIALHDVIRVSLSRGRGIEIRCANPRVPRDESNTCYRIIEKAMAALRAKGRVLVEIEKLLPVQGGMGGASSNAVAALLGLERTLKKFLPAEKRLRIAADVGSDLPLFLVGGTTLGVGRGEQVYPLQDLPSIPCVVITPEVGVSTPKAFAEWDRLCGPCTPFDEFRAGPAREAAYSKSGVGRRTEKPVGLGSTGQSGAAVPTKTRAGDDRRNVSRAELTGLRSSDRIEELGRGLSAWLSDGYTGAPRVSDVRRGRARNPLLALVRTGIKNDFERVVFPEYPELSEGKKALGRAGALYASLSGSGSTLYGLFASQEAARTAVEKLRRQGWPAQATVTLPRSQYWRRIFDC